MREAENPGEQLPIAAGPSMLPGRGDVVALRKLLDHLDVGNQSGAREDSFEQIVTQKCVIGKSGAERGFENIDVVNPLSAVRSLAE